MNAVTHASLEAFLNAPIPPSKARLAPTPEQEAILDAAKNSKQSLMISAYAGTGKTTTLEMISQALPSQPALALAFNVKIKKELEKRFPANFEILTLNGLGHRAFGRAINKRLQVDEKKLGKIVTAVTRRERWEPNPEDWSALRELVSDAMLDGVIPKEMPQKPLVEDDEDTWRRLCEEAYIEWDDKYMYFGRKILQESINQSFAGIVSFDDQIYCSTMFGGVFPRFPLVLVDESQDLSPLNHIQVRRCAADRLIVVGDKLQCFPPGTKITLPRNQEIDIKDIKEGQLVVSYNTQKSLFKGMNTQGRKVLTKKEFAFDGHLVTISTNAYQNKNKTYRKDTTLADLGLDLPNAEPTAEPAQLHIFEHSCTPNHKCLVRITDADCYCIYLMQKGTQYRIGIAKVVYNSGFGPAMRSRQENADACWVLRTVTTKEEALIEEKVLCTEFGLPDLVFVNNGMTATPQHMLDSAWSRIGDNTHRAKKCLQAFWREHAYPLWRRQEETNEHIGSYSFVTEACNLLPTIMKIKPFLNNDKCSEWTPINSITHTPYKGPVYGIEVEPTENGRRLYIANGIVTHNSIYAFRGADSQSIEKLRAMREQWIDLPLATTFRCPKIVVERQQGHAKGFVAFGTNAEGSFSCLPVLDPKRPDEETTWKWEDVASQATGEIAILCRNNAPLLSMAFKLIRAQVACQMLGRDIGKGLITLSKKLLPLDDIPAKTCLELIEDWRLEEASKAQANEQDHKVDSINDRAACLVAVLTSSKCATAGDLRRNITDLFARDNEHVTLSTGHKAKGLEWETVVHLNPHLVPAKWALKRGGAALEQERNLKYVIETRTKNILINATLKDFE